MELKVDRMKLKSILEEGLEQLVEESEKADFSDDGYTFCKLSHAIASIEKLLLEL